MPSYESLDRFAPTSSAAPSPAGLGRLPVLGQLESSSGCHSSPALHPRLSVASASQHQQQMQPQLCGGASTSGGACLPTGPNLSRSIPTTTTITTANSTVYRGSSLSYTSIVLVSPPDGGAISDSNSRSPSNITASSNPHREAHLPRGHSSAQFSGASASASFTSASSPGSTARGCGNSSGSGGSSRIGSCGISGPSELSTIYSGHALSTHAYPTIPATGNNAPCISMPSALFSPANFNALGKSAPLPLPRGPLPQQTNHSLPLSRPHSHLHAHSYPHPHHSKHNYPNTEEDILSSSHTGAPAAPLPARKQLQQEAQLPPQYFQTSQQPQQPYPHTLNQQTKLQKQHPHHQHPFPPMLGPGDHTQCFHQSRGVTTAAAGCSAFLAGASGNGNNITGMPTAAGLKPLQQTLQASLNPVFPHSTALNQTGTSGLQLDSTNRVNFC
ncbi:unnamed protein product [Protopolystoma xenopodis]|uniref:Uncharacterized protein n=1 Tax=Protopolystoma xenopodis TaxID=117903 RepID=A0A3S5FFZ1_9PLAT|nr:unnamed protein product [Protopolystoma xenopodis]